MKLASKKTAQRDGALLVVSKDLSRMASAAAVVPTLQQAIESWDSLRAPLEQLAEKLEQGAIPHEPYDPTLLAAPLPRAYQWADGSAYLSHMKLVRKARGAEMPEGFNTEPLMYQGGSDAFPGPTDPIPCVDTAWGLDFEGEIAIITDDVPLGCSSAAAREHIKLIMLCNDISLRNIMRPELQKGFGFFQSKPPTAFSPVCVTPDELGGSWDGGKVSLPLLTTFNGEAFGRVNAGVDLSFDFPRLISHAARTRALSAGTIIGSGTVSNENYAAVGSSCLAERRMIQILESGAATQRFMEPGDRIRFEMMLDGQSVFGAIDQVVVQG